MKHLFLAYFFTLSLTLRGADVVHPEPKKPLYLAEGWYETLKTQVPPPPAKTEKKQKLDVGELQTLQKIRTKTECERAKSEIFVSLGNFFGAPNGPLQAPTVEKLSPFFEQIRNDGDYFVQKLKKDYPRQRPFLYVRKLKPCVDKEVTNAYPSGHAVLSRLYAKILTDFFPVNQKAFERRAKQIGDNRILSGMHHRSDVEVGRQVGDLIYVELQKSEQYKMDFAKLKTDLSGAASGAQ